MLTTKFQIKEMTEPKKHRKEITIETHSVTIIRTQGGKPSNTGYCRNCKMNTTVFRITHAVLIFRTALTELEKLRQTDQIHFAENGDLCGNSLAAFFSREIRYIKD